MKVRVRKKDFGRLVAPLPVDEDKEIRNGYPATNIYLPKDPGRRQRLLEALGMKESK